MNAHNTVADTKIGDIFVVVNNRNLQSDEVQPLLRGEGHNQILNLKTGLPVYHYTSPDDVVLILHRRKENEERVALDAKKARALMIVIEKMIVRYQNQHASNLDEEIFKLFETAKKVKFAETEVDFQNALADL